MTLFKLSPTNHQPDSINHLSQTPETSILGGMDQQFPPRGRGHRGRGRGQAPGGWRQQQQNPHHLNQPQQSTPFTVGPDSFPPLGSNQTPVPRSADPGQSMSEPQSLPHHTHNISGFDRNGGRAGSPRDFQEFARGNYHGGRNFRNQRHQGPQISQYLTQPAHPAQFHNYARPPPRNGQIYNPHAGIHSGSPQQQQAMRHRIMRQADYLANIGKQSYAAYRFTEEEGEAKNGFRLSLEEIARNALGATYPDLQLDQVKLKCYGSLANGFALKNCDMDLLLALPAYQPSTLAATTTDEQCDARPDETPESKFKADVQRILEKAFLEHSYGARLLTQTRVPILRICQTPTPGLLANLQEERAKWEKSLDDKSPAQEGIQESETPNPDVDGLGQAVSDLQIMNSNPRRSNRGKAGLEFTDGCGIQCDINFSNFVALHNSNMLRLYQRFDPRVREIGIFVKIWAKTRDVNTPYRGTLSSYGWVLMVLHYLMNIAQPPVIPNLQFLAKTEDSWYPDRPIELFEGFDVRFVQDPQSLQEIRQDMAANPNRESSGQLLRGFFQYYGTHQGFHWTRDIISIRTKGGVLSKQVKGWTEAKWQQGQQDQKRSVRNRYLFAIEDPFETEHNIARTVGHHGIVTIRDEFRRAWDIIDKIGTDEEIPSAEFLSPVTDRVDTLKKDQDAYRQRQMQMRREIEAKEKATPEQNGGNAEAKTDGMLGFSDQEKSQTGSFPETHREPSESKLTSTTRPQDPKQRWRTRAVMVDSDDEAEESSSQATGANRQNTKSQKPSKPSSACDGSQNWEEQSSRASSSRLHPISWDTTTEGGRFLCWRDRKILTGKWQGPGYNAGEWVKLHKDCPFNPNMTHKELEEKNELLRRCYARTIHPVNLQSTGSKKTAEPSPPPPPVAGPPMLQDRATTPCNAAHQENEITPQPSPSSPVPSKSSPMSPSPIPVAWSDDQPSQDSISDKAPTTPGNSDRSPDLKLLRMQRLAFFTKEMTETKSEVDTNEQFYIPSAGKQFAQIFQEDFQTPVQTQIQLATLPDHQERVAIHEGKGCDASTQHEDRFSNIDMQDSDSPTKDGDDLKVPATLFPGVDNSKRPADENPNIMPIPRILGFKFDPRQMQDLAVIAKGGNGCARKGAEFNLEADEYEWGGGGMMGYRTNTSPQVAGPSMSHTPYEAGRGDEEGYLDELPRNWDARTNTDC